MTLSLGSDQAIGVRELSMTYRVPVRDAGFAAAARALVRRRYRDVHAVRQINFSIDTGEVVGFLGPNGAGKTTAMKMLAGILHPTAGQIRVLGNIPWQRHHDHLRQIAFIRGSRPVGDAPELTVLDTLRYQQVLYDIDDSWFRKNLGELTELLDLDDILQRQVRALSLGERMRSGLALALVYRPKVLFLDEPTIGLDVTAAKIIRRFIAAYAARTGATVLLTSHTMADVESLCPRLMLIDDGVLAFDGDREKLSSIFAPTKLIRATVTDDQPDLTGFGDVLHHDQHQWLLRVSRDAVPAATSQLLAEFTIADLSVEEPSLEDVMDEAYRALRRDRDTAA